MLGQYKSFYIVTYVRHALGCPAICPYFSADHMRSRYDTTVSFFKYPSILSVRARSSL